MIATRSSFSAPKLPEILIKTSYNINKQIVFFLCHWYDDINWTLVNLTAVYDKLNNVLIDGPTHFDITKEYMDPISRPEKGYQAKYFQFDISGRHIWSKQLILSFTLVSSQSKILPKTVRIDVSSIFF